MMTKLFGAFLLIFSTAAIKVQAAVSLMSFTGDGFSGTASVSTNGSNNYVFATTLQIKSSVDQIDLFYSPVTKTSAHISIIDLGKLGMDPTTTLPVTSVFNGPASDPHHVVEFSHMGFFDHNAGIGPIDYWSIAEANLQFSAPGLVSITADIGSGYTTLSEPGSPTGYALTAGWTIGFDSEQNAQAVEASMEAVPEPTSLSAFCLVIPALLSRKWRRR